LKAVIEREAASASSHQTTTYKETIPMIPTNLRQLRESLGPRGFHEQVKSLLDTGELSPSEFSIRQLWEACVGPTHLTLPTFAARQRTFITDIDQLEHLHTEADLGTNLFQTVTGSLISRRVIDAYNQADGMIGDELVSVERSSVKNERIAGFTALQGPKEVLEGMPYEEASFGDKYVTTMEAKKGRLLSITEEAVHFDQTGELLRRAAMIGEATRLEREKTIVRGVIDADYVASTSGVYRPSGTLEQLYPTNGSNTNYVGVGNTTAGAPFNAAVVLEDWTDIDFILRYHATQVKDDRHGPEAGEPIIWMPKIILVPKNKQLTALRIVNATNVMTRTDSDTQRTEFKNPFGGVYTVLSSPFIDAVSADDWYLGDFRRQFIWKEIWPVQVFRQSNESDAGFERDVVARFKVRYYGGINAVDEKHVVKVDGV
jgi:hypothetical protein